MYKVTHTYPVWECGTTKMKVEKRSEYYNSAEDAIN